MFFEIFGIIQMREKYEKGSPSWNLTKSWSILVYHISPFLKGEKYFKDMINLDKKAILFIRRSLEEKHKAESIDYQIKMCRK
ncbi:hypothetical protein EIZ39_23790 [Ammoniphilus sp. CFH 90114]|nr:hypothetical protein EIZ39_23790 [Ammoniphilus sp. CFH 90114]